VVRAAAIPAELGGTFVAAALDSLSPKHGARSPKTEARSPKPEA